MKGITKVDRMGDINFGLPADLAPHVKPWAYYDIMGVSRDAGVEELKAAKKRLSLEYHPDRVQHVGAEAVALAEERQKRVLEIAEVLLDDGGELGPEWSKRRLYDDISRYGDYFGAVHITHKGERTITLAEELLDVLELERRSVRVEHNFRKEHPGVADLIELVHAADQRGEHYKAREYSRQVVERLAQKESIPVEEFVRRQREKYEAHQRELRKRGTRMSQFEHQLAQELRAEREQKRADPPSQHESAKVFDIWYNGRRNGFSTVTFGNTDWPYCAVTEFKETENGIHMSLEQSAVLSGMRRVHFKARYVQIRITDAYVEGIFQIVNGTVTIEYEGSSYGAVLRVRAPKVVASEDFVQDGDLYIPKTVAIEGWKDHAPALDIAVFEGSVDMRLKRPEIQPQRSGSLICGSPFYADLHNYALETTIGSFDKINRKDNLNRNKW